MQGPHSAKLFVNKYLEGDLPRRLTEYRFALRDEGKWYVDDETLPTPALYLGYEPTVLDVWPTIITMAMSTTNLTRDDYVTDVMDPLYRVIYSMRTYVWVRTEGEEATTLMRDRLTTVVRSSLLDNPCLRANDPANFLEVLIDEGTMREEFSDLTPVKGDRYLAGAYISFDMAINERITRAPLGIATEIRVEEELMPYE